MRKLGLCLVILVTAIIMAGCSDERDFTTPYSTAGNSTLNFVSPGPCPVTEPVGYAYEVKYDGRVDFSCPDSAWGPASNVVGAPDGVFASLGGRAGNYLVVEMEKGIADRAGADLVVFSVDFGDSAEGYYNVYLSDNADSQFVLVDTVRTQGNWCIDLAGSGVTSGKYVKIEQAFGVAGFDTLPACSTSYGADIDAIGVLNEACLTIDDLCEYVGAIVDTMCPPDDEYGNHGEYVSCVAHAATEVLLGIRMDPCYDEYFFETVHGCVVSKRARTDIGKKDKG